MWEKHCTPLFHTGRQRNPIACFSALWWARLGSFFVRGLHLLIFIRHSLMLYVDDFLVTQDAATLDATASLVLAFCVCFNIPLSWKKLLGPQVVWIGWCINVRAGCFSIPRNKRLKLHMHVGKLAQARFAQSNGSYSVGIGCLPIAVSVGWCALQGLTLSPSYQPQPRSTLFPRGL